jgi:RimJ/RimL family protein N-acetyltransferase
MVLEPIGPDHGVELAKVMCDPQVARWLSPDGKPPTRERCAEAAIERAEHWREHGFGLWLMRDAQTGEVIGRGGLLATEDTGCTEVEVGWAVIPERWGNGYATELAEAAVAYAFDTLDLQAVVAFALSHNFASRRVMDKTNFRYERDLLHSGLPHLLYRRRRC